MNKERNLVEELATLTKEVERLKKERILQKDHGLNGVYEAEVAHRIANYFDLLPKLQELRVIFHDNRSNALPEKTYKPNIEFDQCYIRDDFHAVHFNSDQCDPLQAYLRGMREIGNYFNTREEANYACELLCDLLGIKREY